MSRGSTVSSPRHKLTEAERTAKLWAQLDRDAYAASPRCAPFVYACVTQSVLLLIMRAAAPSAACGGVGDCCAFLFRLCSFCFLSKMVLDAYCGVDDLVTAQTFAAAKRAGIDLAGVQVLRLLRFLPHVAV